MKLSHLVSFACGAAVMLVTGAVTQSRAQAPGHVYELRMYHTHPGKLPNLNARFRDHTVGIFNRHNMKSVGYWTPQDGPDVGNLLIYVLDHPSRAEADKNWKEFNADPEWVKTRTESEVSGAIVAKVDRYFMTPTDYSALK